MNRPAPAVILLCGAALAAPAAAQAERPDAEAAAEQAEARSRALASAPPPTPEPLPRGSVFFERDPSLLDENGQPNDARLLAQVSTFHVAAPEPKVLAKHDLVTIIVDENSKQSTTQKLETEKSGNIGGTYGGAIDPWKLLQLRLQEGRRTNLNLVDVRHDREFESEGKAEAQQQMSARITARIIDVKPNGTLVLEARKVIETDDNKQTFLLTGLVRRDDVTDRNTVLSSQIAELEITQTHEGEIRRSTKKGIITRALESLFAF